MQINFLHVCMVAWYHSTIEQFHFYKVKSHANRDQMVVVQNLLGKAIQLFKYKAKKTLSLFLDREEN